MQLWDGSAPKMVLVAEVLSETEAGADDILLGVLASKKLEHSLVLESEQLLLRGYSVM